MDAAALNYNMVANAQDNSTCEYSDGGEPVLGCTDATSCNYDETATWMMALAWAWMPWVCVEVSLYVGRQRQWHL